MNTDVDVKCELCDSMKDVNVLAYRTITCVEYEDKNGLGYYWQKHTYAGNSIRRHAAQLCFFCRRGAFVGLLVVAFRGFFIAWLIALIPLMIFDSLWETNWAWPIFTLIIVPLIPILFMAGTTKKSGAKRHARRTGRIGKGIKPRRFTLASRRRSCLYDEVVLEEHWDVFERKLTTD